MGVVKLVGVSPEPLGPPSIMVDCSPENEANTKESGAEIGQISKPDICSPSLCPIPWM